MNDMDVINKIYSMVGDAWGHEGMEQYISSHAAGAYEMVYRTNRIFAGVKQYYWFTGGTYFEFHKEYLLSKQPQNSIDSMDIIESMDITLSCGHLCVEGKPVSIQESRGKLQWDTGEMILTAERPQSCGFDARIPLMEKAIRRGYDSKDMIEYLGKPNASPSAYLILPEQEIGNMDVARAAYHSLYMECWQKYIMVDADLYHEPPEPVLEAIGYPPDHKADFLQSHHTVAAKLDMNRHFSQAELSCLAYETLHMAGERSLLMDFVAHWNALNPASERYQREKPTADFCMECLREPRIPFTPRPPVPFEKTGPLPF